MSKVRREDIVDYVTYNEGREAFRKKILTIKEPRRIQFGDYFTFLFENHQTILYQVQEMMRAEQIVKEADIQHEIDTYNELIGNEGELGCTLMIEIETAEERSEKLKLWKNLTSHIFMTFENGQSAPALYDERQIGDEQLSSVQYLKFKVGGNTPKGLKIDHPECQCETEFSDQQLKALLEDLRGLQ